ncbi:polysaccharide biosynthesis tyrosine autokinase [Curtobacterium luteum]|uniref:polysaccharide biosynthesis tyrosine autokinase n=1 Tax=Curtobacterium TaxID=2034 RepID=UPI00034A9668|nr:MULTISPECIES: polysaccharide biosynthesis tyrosine autokinase [Curtobacterium]NUU51458.1 polysaccharide biosynthesis tyrosine autokinase [Curtobacterium luteum]
MDTANLVKVFRKGWLLIVIGLLLGGGAGLAAAEVATPEYTAAVKLFVAVRTPDAASATDVSQGNAAAQQKVRSYADVVLTESILQPVIDELHLDTTPTALARRVEPTINTNTVVMTIAVTDASAERSARIADAIGTSFIRVIEGLEKPSADATSLVRASTIQSAVVPSAPSSPNKPLHLAVGLALGTLLGFGAALLRSVVDTRVHGPRDVAATTESPILATLGFDGEAKRRPLIVSADPRNPLAEAYRALRTNLQFVDLGAGNGSFVVTSAMPSEGKTTSTANLAIALAETGARVVLIDADLRRPRVAEVMGIENAAGLTDLLIGRAEVHDVVQPWGRTKLDVLPAGLVPPNPSELLGSAAMQALLELLTEQYDHVLLDAPPLLPVTDAAVLATMTSGAVVVTSARSSRTPQLRAALDRLDRVGASVLGVVVSMVAFRGRAGYGGAYGSAYGAYYGGTAAIDITAAAPRRGRRLRDAETAAFPVAPAVPNRSHGDGSA